MHTRAICFDANNETAYLRRVRDASRSQVLTEQCTADGHESKQSLATLTRMPGYHASVLLRYHKMTARDRDLPVTKNLIKTVDHKMKTCGPYCLQQHLLPIGLGPLLLITLGPQRGGVRSPSHEV